jgi:hypothetical protein
MTIDSGISDRDQSMTSIDFRQKLHDAHQAIADLDGIDELSGVDLDRLFLELSDAAEDQGADVSVGTSDEIRALLLADFECLHGSLIPVGPSLGVAWNGKVRKYCLGLDPKNSEDGADGWNLKLLSWSGTWPDIEFDMDLEMETIEDFFDALVCEVAVIQMEAQAVARIVDGGKPRKPERPFLKNGTKIGNYLALAGLVTFVVPIALWVVTALSPDYGNLVVRGLALGGLLFMASGFHNLKHAADSCGQEIRYSQGLWRVLAGAVLIAIPALTAMMTTTIYISTDYGFPPASF